MRGLARSAQSREESQALMRTLSEDSERGSTDHRVLIDWVTQSSAPDGRPEGPPLCVPRTFSQLLPDVAHADVGFRF